MAGDDDDSHPSNWWMSFFSSGELIKNNIREKAEVLIIYSECVQVL